MAKNKMMQTPLFGMLLNGLRDVQKDALPEEDLLAIGFTERQMKRMDLKHPRLIWFDAKSKTFYDQGDASLMKQKDWYSINEKTFKRNKPLDSLSKYCILKTSVLKEAEQTTLN